MRVLVIDDESPLQHLMALVLTLDGFEVIAATNPKEAIAVTDDVDAVVLDLAMRAVDGMAFYRQLREHANTPVLLVCSSDAAAA